MWNPSGTRDNSFTSRSTALTTPNRPSLGAYPPRGSVPTAKVPSYMNRVKQSTRDMRPGLLPTPDFPPMRPAELMIETGYVEGDTCGQNHGRGRSLVCEDVYATPYADSKKTSSDLHRAGSATSNPNSLYSEYCMTTPSSICTRSKRPEEGKISTQQNNREGLNDEDIMSSLLKLLIGSETTQEEVNVDLMESIAGFYLPFNNDTT